MYKGKEGYFMLPLEEFTIKRDSDGNATEITVSNAHLAAINTLKAKVKQKDLLSCQMLTVFAEPLTENEYRELFAIAPNARIYQGEYRDYDFYTSEEELFIPEDKNLMTNEILKAIKKMLPYVSNSERNDILVETRCAIIYTIPSADVLITPYSKIDAITRRFKNARASLNEKLKEILFGIKIKDTAKNFKGILSSIQSSLEFFEKEIDSPCKSSIDKARFIIGVAKKYRCYSFLVKLKSILQSAREQTISREQFLGLLDQIYLYAIEYRNSMKNYEEFKNAASSDYSLLIQELKGKGEGSLTDTLKDVRSVLARLNSYNEYVIGSRLDAIIKDSIMLIKGNRDSLDAPLELDYIAIDEKVSDKISSFSAPDKIRRMFCQNLKSVLEELSLVLPDFIDVGKIEKDISDALEVLDGEDIEAAGPIASLADNLVNEQFSSEKEREDYLIQLEDILSKWLIKVERFGLKNVEMGGLDEPSGKVKRRDVVLVLRIMKDMANAKNAFVFKESSFIIKPIKDTNAL